MKKFLKLAVIASLAVLTGNKVLHKQRNEPSASPDTASAMRDGPKKHLPGENDPSVASLLNQSYKTKHFVFYFAEKKPSLENVFNILGKNYARLTRIFGISFKKRIRVEIYPNIRLYHQRTFGINTPDWAVGNFDPRDKTLRMVSPNHPGSYHSSRSVVKIAVHEFVHCVVFKYRDDSRKGLPTWLDEGTADYYSDGFSKKGREVVEDAVGAGKIPSLSDIESDFLKNNGYPFAYTLVDFIVKKFGQKRLLDFIKDSPSNDPASYERHFSMTKEAFNSAWRQFLKETYNSAAIKTSRSGAYQPPSPQ